MTKPSGTGSLVEALRERFDAHAKAIGLVSVDEDKENRALAAFLEATRRAVDGRRRGSPVARELEATVNRVRPSSAGVPAAKASGGAP
jgi:hypothetical protein